MRRLPEIVTMLLAATTFAGAMEGQPEPFSQGTQTRLASGEASPVLAHGDVRIEQRLGEQLPLDLSFRDHQGRNVRLGTSFGDGKPVVLSFAYYRCPMLCPLVLNDVQRALNAVSWTAGEEFRVVTVSIDSGDDPAAAAEKRRDVVSRYARSPGKQDWAFLTGDAEAIRKLAAAAGFRYRYDESSGQFAHAAGIFVLTPGGRIARVLYGLEFSARDLRLALVEASENRIGNVVDQILLLCFHYDPTQGRYSAAVLTGVRVGGALTVLSLGGFLFTMWRREKRSA